MKEKPILFSGPMVRAILEDRKTQTRRVMKIQPRPHVDVSAGFVDGRYTDGAQFYKVPYGQPGDRLWVRETFALWHRTSVEYSLEWDTITDKAADALEVYGQNIQIAYRADGEDDSGWRPSIFMPRWASRITLEITEVRVQRLQDISEEDAIAEGIGKQFLPDLKGNRFHWHDDKQDRCTTAAAAFHGLWDSINGKTYPWYSNPFVWAITFKRVGVQE